ncbi:hypothetical protein [Ornithinimicrobium kibberense]|uniref:hypothetical protein n=1 Tax=Ornithinimicrobium kibberense TaxID=282060 RepID=UPI00361A5954
MRSRTSSSSFVGSSRRRRISSRTSSSRACTAVACMDCLSPCRSRTSSRGHRPTRGPCDQPRASTVKRFCQSLTKPEPNLWTTPRLWTAGPADAAPTPPCPGASDDHPAGPPGTPVRRGRGGGRGHRGAGPRPAGLAGSRAAVRPAPARVCRGGPGPGSPTSPAQGRRRRRPGRGGGRSPGARCLGERGPGPLVRPDDPRPEPVPAPPAGPPRP